MGLNGLLVLFCLDGPSGADRQILPADGQRANVVLSSWTPDFPPIMMIAKRWSLVLSG